MKLKSLRLAYAKLWKRWKREQDFTDDRTAPRKRIQAYLDEAYTYGLRCGVTVGGRHCHEGNISDFNCSVCNIDKQYLKLHQEVIRYLNKLDL